MSEDRRVTTLLPCPFCGGSDVRYFPPSVSDGPPRVMCCADDCGADIEADHEADARRRWNRRAEKQTMSDKPTFTCAHCGGVFNKGWSDEEAWSEYRETQSEVPESEPTDLICDGCYVEFLAWLEAHPEERHDRERK